MILQLNLTGIARECAGAEGITIKIEHSPNFHKALLKAIPGLKDYFYLVSVNGKLSADLSQLTEEDKIMIFSPVAGG